MEITFFQRKSLRFFKQSRHQSLVPVVDELEGAKKEEDEEEDEDCFLFDCDHVVEVGESPATESTKLVE